MQARRSFLVNAAFFFIALPAALAQQVAMGGYPVPTAHSGPSGIVAGPDGALWFAESGANQIGRITTAGLVTGYPVSGGSFGITVGPDNALWFTEFSTNKIGRITTTGAVTEYAVPTAGAVPEGITAGPDGALWFTEFSGNKIGRITTAGVISEYALSGNLAPVSITAGPDGALWFIETNNIGRITTAGAITQHSLGTGLNSGGGITTGPDGALWFTDSNGNQVGRITTAGAIREYSLPSGNSEPGAIITGPDGALWFTQAAPGSNQLGRITTAGAISEYPIPTPNTEPLGLALGPDGALWFTGYYSDKIWQAVFPTAGLAVTPDVGSYQAALTFTGNGFGPNEKVLIFVGGIGSTVLAGATTDATGSFTASAHAPQSPYAPRLFLGLGQSSGALGAATFYARAQLILSPSSGAAGSTVTAQCYGFGSLEPVQIYWNNPSTLLGTATAGVNGTGSLTFTVPAGAPAGVNKLHGIGTNTGAHGYGTFTVQ